MTTIPNKREVFFLLSTNNDFIEKTMLAMFKRHQANKGVLNGKGFSRTTKRDGERLGRWLAKVGTFTSGTNGSGTMNRSSKTREEHLEAARQVLFNHVDQIIDMIAENVRAEAVKKAAHDAQRREQLALNGARSREIIEMLTLEQEKGRQVPADERPTERNLGGGMPWMGTGYRRTG